MATFDLTDPKEMTVKKGGTTQVLLFSDALKNSSNSAEWREHEVRFAKTIEAIAPITSKLEELKAKEKENKPSLHEMGSLYQAYTRAIEQIKRECQSCIHLIKERHQSERRKVLQLQTSGLEHLFKQSQTLFPVLGKYPTVRNLLIDKGEFLRFCKLSDQFYNSHVKIQEEIVKSDSLTAQGARSTKVKSALPKVREMKDEMDKTLYEQRTLMNLGYANQDLFSSKEAILADVKENFRKQQLNGLVM